MKASNCSYHINKWIPTEKIKKLSVTTKGLCVVFIGDDQKQYKLNLEPYQKEEDV